jgi:orotate phosphoribosyltransferase
MVPYHFPITTSAFLVVKFFFFKVQSGKENTMDSLPPWKLAFLKDSIRAGALTFGTFTLKSKRISPYFFNAGLLHRGDILRSISTAFAYTIAASQIDFDVLFGPAYKAIPLSATAVDKLVDVDPKYGNVSYSFNRKEAKDHGEGGNIVGAPLKGKRVMIIDDVITAGTAIREAINIIQKEGGTLVGIVIAVDRQEKTPSATDDDGTPRPSTLGQVRKEYGIPVLPILTLDDIIAFSKTLGTEEELQRLQEYQRKYRATD